MVIEYFAGQAAEDAPAIGHGDNEAAWDAFHKHEWLTRHTACIAVEREIHPHDWHTVIVNIMDLQTFDRNPASYLFERGYDDSDSTKDWMRDVLTDLVGWAVHSAYHNSKVDW